MRGTATHHPLGRIGGLAEDLRSAARAVTDDMHLTPGGDAYEYRGTVADVQNLIDRLNDMEHWLAGWVP